jgi:hypothetical protein
MALPSFPLRQENRGYPGAAVREAGMQGGIAGSSAIIAPAVNKEKNEFGRRIGRGMVHCYSHLRQKPQEPFCPRN